MRKIYLFIAVFLTATLSAQNSYTYYDTLELGCGNVRITVPQNILDNEGAHALEYSVSTIQYIDDSLLNFQDYDPLSGMGIPMGFNFYFFGVSRKYAYIDENNFIGFTSHAGTDWPIKPIPNDSFQLSLPPRNCILAPWTLLAYDFWSGNGTGTIRYGLKGTAPFRRFIIEFRNIPIGQCLSGTFNGTTILYESTNVIETHILSKPLCNQFGADKAVHGLHHANGQTAIVVQGRNATEWSAYNEGTRFLPGDTLYLLSSTKWYNDQNQLVSTNDTIDFPIGLSNDYTSVATYINVYGGDTIIRTKSFHIIVDTGDLQLASTGNLTYTNGVVTTCGNGSLNATGMDWYEWKNSSGDIISQNNGVFNITSYSGPLNLVGYKNGCYDSLQVTILNQANVNSITYLTCPNQIDTLINTIPGATWLTQTGDTASTSDTLLIYGAPNGYYTYFQLAIPAGQCINFDHYTVQTWLSLSYSSANNSLHVSPSGIYVNWYYNNTLIPGEHSDSLVITQPGNYYALYFTSNGCGPIGTQTYTAVSVTENKYSFDVYPNPAKDFITIKTENFTGKIYTARFLNMMGQQVYTTSYTTPNLPLRQLPNGIYLLQLITSEGVISKKIIIEN